MNKKLISLSAVGATILSLIPIFGRSSDTLQSLAQHQGYFLLASFGFIAIALWYQYFHKAKTAASSSCCAPAPSNNSCCGGGVSTVRVEQKEYKPASSLTDHLLIWLGFGVFAWSLFFESGTIFTGSGGDGSIIGTLQYFVFITAELIALFILVTAIVEVVMMYIPQEKLKNKLSGKGIRGNILAAAIGAITPFCACSTIPMTVGFLNAGVAFGSVMSFLIASPLLNPIIIGMLAALLGAKFATIYFFIAFLSAVLFGYILEKMGASKWIKNTAQKQNNSCACDGSVENIQENKRKWSLSKKSKEGLKSGYETLRPIILYLIFGVALGAGIYGYMPDDFVLQVAGKDNPLAVPVAAIIGVPLYIRAETAIPIGIALMGKGMSVGAVVALIIGGAGMAIPEMSLMASIFKKRLVACIVLTIFLTAVIGGYLFNLVL